MPRATSSTTAALVDLARHYGFQPRACRPYRAKTKGKVERPFRYIREDFFLAGSFRNLDDLNAQLRHWLDTVANPRVHATTQRVVAEAFAEEQAALKPLPLVPFRAVLKLERRVSHEGMVSVGGNLYSVPDPPAGASSRCIAGRRDPDLRGRLLIAAHPVLEGRGQRRDRSRSSPRAMPPPAGSRLTDEPPPCSAAPARSVARRSLDFYEAVGRRLAPREAVMTASALEPTAVLDRIRRNLVGLKMPRALEILDADRAPARTRRDQRARGDRQAARRGTHAAREPAGQDGADDGPALDDQDARRLRLHLPALARPQPHPGARQLEFIDRHEVVHLLGPPGTGKSHLAVALGVEAVKAGRSVYFVTLADLVASLAKAEREGTLRERIRFFCRFALLIVDEIGYLPVVPGGGNLFFQLVNARYERAP